MEINVIQNQDQLKISTASAERLVNLFISFAKVSYDEVSIYFIDSNAMCQLHEDYFGDPSPTDCISFPIDEAGSSGYCMMGDVFVSPQTAVDYVHAHGGNEYEELTLYVIHGLLHLIGYDDIEDEDRIEMRKAETVHLENVRENNLWLHP